MPSQSYNDISSDGEAIDRVEDLIVPKEDDAEDADDAGSDSELSSPLLVPAEASQPISYREHLVTAMKLTYPIVSSEIFQNTLPAMDIAFVGQLGKEELGAAALATTWFNLCNGTMIGFMTAIDTLLSQTYGAHQYQEYGIWTGNSLFIGVMALCGPCMHLFGQDPDIADAAGEFSLRLIPGLFPYYLFKVLTKSLQTQHILAQGVWIGIFANICNGLFNWALIFKAGWGIAGSPWATTLTRTLELFLISGYMLIRKNSLKDTWPHFSMQYLSFEVMKPFWHLGLTGAVAIAATIWAFEITTILAGLLGTVQLGAHIITLSIDGIVFQSFAFSIGIAASIQVGKLMGKQKPDDARRSSHVFFSVGLFIQLLLIGVLIVCKDILGSALSVDKDVANLVSQLIPIMCVFMLGDSFQATLGGVLRGLGRQTASMVLNICAFWVVGITSGAIYAFVAGLGVYGLWWGLSTGIYFTSIIGIIILCRVDWKEEARKTLRRLTSISTGIASATQHSSRSASSFSADDSIDGEKGESDWEYQSLREAREETTPSST